MLTNRRILLGIGGGIAAYKVCTVASTLAQAGAEVRAILTEKAQAFVTPLTFATLCRHRAYTDADFWHAIPDRSEASLRYRPLHIELGEWAEVLLLAPLTANTLAKLTYGLADNLLMNTVLASRCPILLAPAMNTDMWEQAIVQQNWQHLTADPRYHWAEPGSGRLACDRVGAGRMAEPATLVVHLQSLLYTQGQRDLQGKQVLINAGGTQEYLDPVRYLGNPSTGKMGVALAQAAQHRGAQVTLVHGPLLGIDPAMLVGMKTVATTTAEEMQQAMLSNFPRADFIFLAAAVADCKPATYHPQKLAKQDLPNPLPLTPVPDIAATLGQQKRPHQYLVGFAAQTGDVVAPALGKLRQKKLDAIAANPIDQPGTGFGSDTNQAVLLDRHGRQQIIEPCSKLEFAHRLLDFVQQHPPDSH
ncbi:bifunctional phosphopantothenoylcysteine decarboxylase/phosphopantothenate--cysteine ligase CoaBC [Trichothermofontia sichuanensis B231]|uniref:bifunctional phosphopantothenoylcysteine decarboxylase/phosphopantothenate--cysteine ligase CoaBC n=1 Tax=Trichothermofontia sichuanensis TaxID=3045816 RepID=UPI0022481CF0|nr:bifunctional phosphopantothenoylcysteine decarboxylase/phosphopantothenate--cysteine ligase CoaBC [Trichothermofontia sichuanensis]UZQ54850.1 bifunctional phosphopantothenoylcysteine decarboxylase/phosphopantothenate--cysteine ligase CoaBC [Trichothermofontia sichuanensis B231]